MRDNGRMNGAATAIKSSLRWPLMRAVSRPSKEHLSRPLHVTLKVVCTKDTGSLLLHLIRSSVTSSASPACKSRTPKRTDALVIIFYPAQLVYVVHIHIYRTVLIDEWSMLDLTVTTTVRVLVYHMYIVVFWFEINMKYSGLLFCRPKIRIFGLHENVRE
jgi:hypothetical protein